MTLARHARGYLIVGGLQWAIDCGLLVVLTSAGMDSTPANILGRIAGASLGYWLNGKLTFRGDDTVVGRTQLTRFILMWLGTTAVSTLSITWIDVSLGLKWAWLAKPAVEALLGATGFFLSRHWVYKR